MTAPMIKDIRINILRFVFKKRDVIKLKYPKMIKINGNSKINPKGRTKDNTKSMY